MGLERAGSPRAESGWQPDILFSANLLDMACANDYRIAVMTYVSGGRSRLPLIAASVVLLFVLAGCGNSSIVGKWRMSGSENQTVWEFLSNGSVLVGEVRGRYKFGDQDRIKIETPFATTVYLVKVSGNQLVLEQPGGSKLEFTRIGGEG